MVLLVGGLADCLLVRISVKVGAKCVKDGGGWRGDIPPDVIAWNCYGGSFLTLVAFMWGLQLHKLTARASFMSECPLPIVAPWGWGPCQWW